MAPTRRGLLHTEPERMTTRARLFMTVVALRNAAIGASLLLAQRQYGPPNAAFTLVRQAMPIPVWGVVMVALGVAAAYSAVVMSRRWATWAIGLSATVSGTWMACFVMQYGILADTAGGMSPMLPILWGALTAKDLVIAAQPMRSPFEPLIQRLLQESPSAHGPTPRGDGPEEHMGEVT